jgi:hypothetical protein
MLRELDLSAFNLTTHMRITKATFHSPLKAPPPPPRKYARLCLSCQSLRQRTVLRASLCSPARLPVAPQRLRRRARPLVSPRQEPI